MKLKYIITVKTDQKVNEIYLSTLAAVKRVIALQKRKYPDAQITYAKASS